MDDCAGVRIDALVDVFVEGATVRAEVDGGVASHVLLESATGSEYMREEGS